MIPIGLNVKLCKMLLNAKKPTLSNLTLHALTVIISTRRTHRPTLTHRAPLIRHTTTLSILLHRRARRRGRCSHWRNTGDHCRRSCVCRRWCRWCCWRATRAVPNSRAGDGVVGQSHGGGGVDVEVDARVGGAVGAGEGDEDG